MQGQVTYCIRVLCLRILDAPATYMCLDGHAPGYLENAFT